MKLKYVISFGMICLLSLGSVFFSIQTDAQEFNRDFRIETITGDESILDTLAFSAVIREGKNDFTKVTLTSNEPKFQPTIFDENLWVGEDILENRELYRNATWAETLETDDLIITHAFNNNFMWRSSVDPSARIAKMDKATGNVEVINPVFNEITRSMQIWNSFLVENEGTFYYVLTTRDQEFLVYSFNPETMTLNFEFRNTLEGVQRDAWLNWFASNEAVYVQMQDENRTIYMIDFETQEARPAGFDFDIETWNIWSHGNHLILQGWEFDEATGNASDTLSIFDKKTGEMTKLEDPSFLENSFGEGEFDSWWSDNTISGNYFIMTITASSWNSMTGRSGTPTQFFAVYDLDTLEIVYEGQIRLRRDQGLLTTSWGDIQGFSVSLRDE